MPTENEIEAMEYFVRGAKKTRERIRLGLEKPDPRTIEQKLIDTIYAPNPLFDKLKKEIV